MPIKTRFLSLLTAILLIFSFSVPAFAYKSKAETALEELKNPEGKILGVSSKGEWGEYPENSIKAIEKAALTGIDFILIDVKKTKDGIYIVFSDDTTKRMLYSDTDFTVADTDYKDLSIYKLKKGCGGAAAEESSCSIPSLEEVLTLAYDKDFALIIRTDASYLPEVSELIYRKNMINSCAVMLNDKIKDIDSAVSQCEQAPCIIGTVKSNIIFTVNSFIKGLKKINAPAAELKSSNRYGINYQDVVTLNHKGIRLVADPAVPEECGARRDTEKWWTNLIDLGYSVIVTDYAELFTEYQNRTDSARDRLSKAYDKYTSDFSLPEFRNKHLNDYKKAYEDAVYNAELLLSDGSSSVQKINDTYLDLMKSANDIKINFDALEDGSESTTITVPRIILCILAAAAVIAVQVYFFRRRKKKEG